MVAVTTDMVVTATATNFHHFDVAVTLSNVLMREASGNAREIRLQEKDQAYRCGRYGECDAL